MASFLSFGIDPGLASMGLSVVERCADGTYRSRGVKVSRTEKNHDKAHTRMRASADDQRRIRQHWEVLTASIQAMQPQVIGVENYLVFEPRDVGQMRDAAQALCEYWPNIATNFNDLAVNIAQPEVLMGLADRVTALQTLVTKGVRNAIGLGQAAKTIAVYGAALGAAFSAGVPVFVFEPHDRTQRIAMKRGASKEEVGAAITRMVNGLAEQMQEKIPQKTLKEHAWDATCYAVLAAEQYMQLKFDVGA